MSEAAELSELDQLIYQKTKMGINTKPGFQAIGSSLDDVDAISWSEKLRPRAESDQPSLCYLRYPDSTAALIFRTPVRDMRGEHFAHALIGSSADLTITRAIASLHWNWKGARLQPVKEPLDGDDLGKVEAGVYGAWADERWAELNAKPFIGRVRAGAGAVPAVLSDPRGYIVITDSTPGDLPVQLLAGLIKRAGSPEVIGNGFATYETSYIDEKSLPRFVFAWEHQRSGLPIDRTSVDLREMELLQAIDVLAEAIGLSADVRAARQYSPVMRVGAEDESIAAQNAPTDADAPPTDFPERADNAAAPAVSEAGTAQSAGDAPGGTPEDMGSGPPEAVGGREVETSLAGNTEGDDGSLTGAEATGNSQDGQESTASSAGTREGTVAWGDAADSGFQEPNSKADQLPPTEPSSGFGETRPTFTPYKESYNPLGQGQFQPYSYDWTAPTDADQRVASEHQLLTDSQVINNVVFLDDQKNDIPAFTKLLHARAAQRELAAQQAAATADRPGGSGADAAPEFLLAAYKAEKARGLTQLAENPYYEPQVRELFRALARLVTADILPGTADTRTQINYIVVIAREGIDPRLREAIRERIWFPHGEVPERVFSDGGRKVLETYGFRVKRRVISGEATLAQSESERERMLFAAACAVAAVGVLLLGAVLLILIAGGHR